MLGFRNIIDPGYIQLFCNLEASGKCDQLLFQLFIMALKDSTYNYRVRLTLQNNLRFPRALVGRL